MAGRPLRLIPSERGQLPLPGVSRRRKPVVPAEPEADVQRAIVRALELYGLTVLTTSRVRRRVCCSNCGAWHWPAGGDGCTAGCPDLFVRRELWSRYGLPWKPNMWLGLEVKPHPKAKVRREQQQLSDNGSIVIVFSAEDALAAVKQVDEWTAR